MATEVEGATSLFLGNAWLVPLAPFIAFLLILWLRNRLPKRGAEIAIPAVGFSLLWSALMFWELLTRGGPAEISIPWMTFGQEQFTLGILVDNLSGFLALLVSFLSFLIVVYSVGYMREEGDRRPRYFAEITLFIAGMLGTVLADNYLLMFMSWEVMGACSYLLIGYWFERPSAARAAQKAFLVTRVGDISLLLGMTILWFVFRSFSYREIFENTAAIEANEGLLFLAGLFIFGGAVGKSAQFPLHVWLPDAMEGPTTVSALIHAATMVKAGVFLVARSYPLFVHTEDLFLIIGAIGGFTALFAATIALVQTDIKRVMAYSTLSQLGYMFLALGAGGILVVQTGDSAGYTSGLFHLMNHAIFKALLFLGAGSVILGMHHQQDLHAMGGLRKHMPITAFTLLIGAFALAGIPPFNGFWSKDEVLASALRAGEHQAAFVLFWAMGVLTALLTAFYVFRMWFLAFTGRPRSHEAEHAHESPAVMTTPLQVLAVFAIVSGAFLFIGLASLLHFDAGHYLAAHAGHSEAHSGSEIFVHMITAPTTYLSIAVALAGVWFAHRVYVGHQPHPDVLVAPLAAHDAHKVLTNLYYYDRAFMGTSRAVGLGLARASALFDRYVIDGVVNGMAWLSRAGGAVARRSQTGIVSSYAVGAVLGLTAIALVLAWILGGA